MMLKLIKSQENDVTEEELIEIIEENIIEPDNDTEYETENPETAGKNFS